MFLSIFNETRNVRVADSVRVARRWSERLIGLLTTAALSDGQGLWLSPCTSVHSFFMRFAIDAVFLDSAQRVLHITTLKPWRFSRWVPKALGVLELPAGTCQRTQMNAGDQLRLQERD